MFEMVWIVGVVVFFVVMFIMMVRLFWGFLFYDWVLVVNLFGIKMVVIFVIFNFMMGCFDFIDIVFFYVFLNFVGMIVVLKFF